ncbi:MAG: hypothetical protein Q9213_005139 [Squamulea squamosa]
MDRPTLIKRLKETDYTDTKALWDLVRHWKLRHCPVTIVGTSRGALYDVVLVTVLHASRPPKYPQDRRMLSEDVLGININVEPVEEPKDQSASLVRRKRSKFQSKKSHHSTNSDDPDLNTFNIMHQIGILRAYQGKYNTTKDAIDDDSRWYDTGFVLVSDITSGKARGIWIVYNFNPTTCSGEEVCHIEDDVVWGWLPGYEDDLDDPSNGQFSVAKVADSVSELGETFTFELRHRLRHEPELVNVVKCKTGKLQRQTVEEKDYCGLPV